MRAPIVSGMGSASSFASYGAMAAEGKGLIIFARKGLHRKTFLCRRRDLKSFHTPIMRDSGRLLSPIASAALHFSCSVLPIAPGQNGWRDKRYGATSNCSRRVHCGGPDAHGLDGGGCSE